MIYSITENFIIRDLEPGDIPEIVAGERAQGWDATPDKYEARVPPRRQWRMVEGQALGEAAAMGLTT